ncbi:hypothetical protein [Streptomyces sp. HD]|uniref:hypothetical protein n=1 Tax=Streptomyces sp. HD TaxID=3020892 RepID=UPI003FA72639
MVCAPRSSCPIRTAPSSSWRPILKGTDWTRQSRVIHVWDSADLRSFGNYRLLKPHAAVNSSEHNAITVNHTTDFRTVTSPQVFFDPGYDVIDGSLAMDVNGVNHLYFKGHNELVGAKSTSLGPGSFTVHTSGLAPQGGRKL